MYLVCPKVAIVVCFVGLLLRAVMEDGEANRLAADVSGNRRSVRVRGSRSVDPPPITNLSAVPSPGVGGATGTLQGEALALDPYGVDWLVPLAVSIHPCH